MPHDRIDPFAQPPGWPIELDFDELCRMRVDPSYVPPASVEERARREAAVEAKVASGRAGMQAIYAAYAERARKAAETRRRRAREAAEFRANLASTEALAGHGRRDASRPPGETTDSPGDGLPPGSPGRKAPSDRRIPGGEDDAAGPCGGRRR